MAEVKKGSAGWEQMKKDAKVALDKGTWQEEFAGKARANDKTAPAEPESAPEQKAEKKDK